MNSCAALRAATLPACRAAHCCGGPETPPCKPRRAEQSPATPPPCRARLDASAVHHRPAGGAVPPVLRRLAPLRPLCVCRRASGICSRFALTVPDRRGRRVWRIPGGTAGENTDAPWPPTHPLPAPQPRRTAACASSTWAAASAWPRLRRTPRTCAAWLTTAPTTCCSPAGVWALGCLGSGGGG